jgi:hypothetical protein
VQEVTDGEIGSEKPLENYTYKSLLGSIFKNRRLRVERDNSYGSPGAGFIDDPVEPLVLYFLNSFMAFISFMPAPQESSFPSYSHLYSPWRLEGIGSRLSHTRTTFLS